MAIPVVYNFRSVRQRWTSAVVAILGIAGTVGVFVAVLSLAKGFKATLVSSGAYDNAIVRRAGSTSEIDSNVPLEQTRILQDEPGVSGGGSHSAIPTGDHRHRCERSDSWCIRQSHGGSPEDQDC
jgi:putative ABC transport system permease protein